MVSHFPFCPVNRERHVKENLDILCLHPAILLEDEHELLNCF